MRKDFQFEELQRGALWAKLALTAGQVADLVGVSQRQVTYWKRRGFLVPSGENPERLNGDDIDMCILIKQALNAGIPLRRAVELARDYIQRELTGGSSFDDFSPQELVDMREKLRGANASLMVVLGTLERLASPEQIVLEGSKAELNSVT